MAALAAILFITFKSQKAISKRRLANGEMMDEALERWRNKYNLENLQMAGYRGGYPMIRFDRRGDMPFLYMKEREKKRILRHAETKAGSIVGVAWNFRDTAMLLVQKESIVIGGHEVVIDEILKAVFQ